MKRFRPNTVLLRRLAAITFLVALLGVQLGLTIHEAQHAACADAAADQDSRCVLCVAMAYFSALIGISPTPVVLVFCGFLIFFPLVAPACINLLSCSVRGPPFLVQSPTV